MSDIAGVFDNMGMMKRAGLLWRWAWLIALGTAVAGSVAYLAQKNAAPVYESTAKLLIDEALASGSDDEGQSLPTAALTYAEILQTEPILQKTVERLELPFTTEQLAEMTTVSIPEGTQIVAISVTDISPERAAIIANALGQTLIEQNREWKTLRYAQPIANWESRLEEIDAQINTLETNEESSAISRLEDAQARYSETFDQLNALYVAQAKENDTIIQIESAQPAHSPASPSAWANALLAALIGGIITIGIVAWVERVENNRLV
ncbi:MAG: hypothetical protein GY803_04620 [Chloroflexi bacterium]|nr:hypothetical protein [Chloroflexota bacterium]